MRDLVMRDFQARYGREPELVVRSPGRVNLIGDHTDYQDGFVFPIAIERATWLAAARRTDPLVTVASHDHGLVDLDLLEIERRGDWSDYIAGTLRAVGAHTGFDASVRTDVPVGAGLSSSASLELAVARAAAELDGRDWDPRSAALAAQSAENDFVGVPCGIMDQMIVAAGRRDRALLIDCRSLELTESTIPHSVRIVILDTGTRRQLAGSEYEERRLACEEASERLGVPALRDADEAMLRGLPDLLRRRARHVVTENSRTVAAAAAFDAGDVAEVGRLMNDSHASLRDDFEVSSAALDAIAEVARRHPGCHGARMTGGGFAGCAVALVDENAVGDFIAAASAGYSDATGHVPTLYETRAAPGVRVESSS